MQLEHDPSKSSQTRQSVAPILVRRLDARRHSWLLAHGCFVYLVFTIAISVRYAFLMQASATNDYYWRGFNTTGTQTFLADMYNSQLAVSRGTGATSLAFNSTLALPKSYDQFSTVIDISSSRARRLVLVPQPWDQVIVAMRNATLNNNLYIPSPFCWVDFARAFELGHSVKRQKRCLEKDGANAAVYLESVLRNTKRSELVSGAFYPMLNASVFSALGRTRTGPVWLTYIHNHTFPSVQDEIDVWRGHGLRVWVHQLCNRYQRGIEESVAIETALGLHALIKINSVAYRPSVSTPSTYLAYVLFGNEISASALFLRSTLVRGDVYHFERLGIDWDAFLVIGPRRTPAINLVRRNIGPFGSIDIRFVGVPPSLALSVAQFRRGLYAALQTHDQAVEIYAKLEPVVTTPIPSPWRSPSTAFYGGNPLCAFGTAKSFVQPSFGNDDKCSSQQPHEVVLERDTVLFALAALGGVDPVQVCAVNVPFNQACVDALTRAGAIYLSLALADSIVPSTWSDVAALNISLIQFATVNSTEVLLVQPWISTPTDAWSFYGWIVMYEWVQGKREVYTFEGDEGVYTTISPRRDFDPLAANPLELPQSACTYVRYITIYVSFALGGVALVLLAYSAWAGFAIGGVHLLHFNRVVGSVWISRPFLLLRGMTAVVLLSTANVAFVAPKGFSQLQLQPRSIFDIAVLAGESTWVSYVVIDVCLPFLGALPPLSSPLSSALGWLVVLVLEVSNPVVPVATLASDCRILSLDIVTQCSEGKFTVGDSTRLVVICAIHLVSVALSVAVALGWRRVATPAAGDHRPLTHVLVPMVAKAYLISEAPNAITLDNLACVMSGMIPLFNTVFDAKLWVTVPIRQDRTTSTLTLPPPQRQARSLPQRHIVSTADGRWLRVTSLLGLGYVAATLSGS